MKRITSLGSTLIMAVMALTSLVIHFSLSGAMLENGRTDKRTESHSLTRVRETRKTLFKITKNENRNFTVYDLLFDRQCRLSDPPLDVYWIMAERDGRREELNGFEERLYGITIENVDHGGKRFRFHVNGVAQKSIYVEMEDAFSLEECKSTAHTTIRGHRAFIEKIHLLIEKTWNPLQPNVKVILTGTAKITKPDGTVRFIKVEETIENGTLKKSSFEF